MLKVLNVYSRYSLGKAGGLFHKTTRRELYDNELARASCEGFFEVIFANEKGEITEGARTNIFIEKDGELTTPSLQSGLLPGIFRQHMIGSGERPAQEAVITLADLEAADKIFVANSVRGMVEVRLKSG